MSDNVVYHLEPDEEVACYFCQLERHHRLYKQGEAFLAGAGHSPLDGNANYVCEDHLDSDAVVALAT